MRCRPPLGTARYLLELSNLEPVSQLELPLGCFQAILIRVAVCIHVIIVLILQPGSVSFTQQHFPVHARSAACATRAASDSVHCFQSINLIALTTASVSTSSAQNDPAAGTPRSPAIRSMRCRLPLPQRCSWFAHTHTAISLGPQHSTKQVHTPCPLRKQSYELPEAPGQQTLLTAHQSGTPRVQRYMPECRPWSQHGKPDRLCPCQQRKVSGCRIT